eukprot:TRINITY_DN19547_c0_g2_i1.p1 TRINITY_DN19547_c0_g2~~TRINITY_DN19547_c0_g2_i1.p1  ORF type:complete len:184 (+),score=40.65 TRINITY_DN19547_c0_g2_i1:25-552(+)
MPYLCLWLLPPEPVFSELKADIDRVISEFGSGPQFEPHLTLLGGVTSMTVEEAQEQLQRLKGTGLVDLQLGGVSGEAKWNQIAVAVSEETESLLQLHRLAREIFKGVAQEEAVTWAPPLARPHLSLAYGTDPAVREKCRSPPSFVCEHVALVSCDPPSLAGVPDWYEVARVSLAP